MVQIRLSLFVMLACIVFCITATETSRTDKEIFPTSNDEKGKTILGLLKELEEDVGSLKTKLKAKQAELKAKAAKKVKEAADITEINDIAGVDGTAKKLGLTAVDGDILETDAQLAITKTNLDPNIQRDAIVNPARRWPIGSNGRYRIPYRLDPAVSGSPRKMAVINAAIAAYKARTKIDIVPARGNEYYIKVISGGGCYSLLGLSRGSRDCNNCQPLSIGNGCESVGTVEHEFMHALGFVHEQSRPDRDNFIRILLQNIRNGLQSQFRKQPQGSINSPESYDFNSIMQYSSYAFSKNRQPTIVKKSNNQPFNANRGGFSPLNIRELNTIYPGNNGGGGGGGGGGGTTGPVRPNPGPGPSTGGSSAKNCEGFARLGLCVYKEVCGMCKSQCTRTALARLVRSKGLIMADSRAVATCRSWSRRGLCKTSQYVKRACMTTCYRAEYKANGTCR